MKRKIKLDPITRVEGHLSVEIEDDGNVVTGCRISGDMYRGFEKFLENRHPFDAARISQRVCGVCHEVHGVASVKALEHLYNIQTPKNGLILRDIILGLNIISDHLLHFYNLTLPDYIDFSSLKGAENSFPAIASYVKNILRGEKGSDFYTDKTGVAHLAESLSQSFEIRSKTAKAIAYIGAKAPFAHALLPGGVTTSIDVERIMAVYALIDDIDVFVKTRMMNDIKILASNFKQYFNEGVSFGNFISEPGFELLEKPLLVGGAIINGERKEFSFNNVFEVTDSSFYDSCGNPSEIEDGAYSWIKSPRYKGYPAETGPLARMIIDSDKGFFELCSSLGGDKLGSSVMHRITARVYETKILSEHLKKLIKTFELGKEAIVTVDTGLKINGVGLGVSPASRGVLIHKITAENGLVLKYDMIVPSTWNFGPKSGEYAGVAEKAVIDTVMDGSSFENSIKTGRIIRSFDPCTACSIH